MVTPSGDALHLLATTVAAVFATTFELLPERLDLPAAILQGAGLLAIFGTALSLIAERRAPGRARPPYTEYFTLAGAAIGLAVFLVGAVAQAVG